MRAARPGRRWPVGVVAAVAAAAGGCGTGQASPDLFAVTRSGDAPGSDVELVVSDNGTVRCDRGRPRPLDSDQVLEARALSRDLAEAAALNLELPPGRDPTLSYRVRLEAGTVSFSDASRDRPPSFDRLVGFVADVSENVCGVER